MLVTSARTTVTSNAGSMPERNVHNARKPEKQHGVFYIYVLNKVVSTRDKRALSQRTNLDSGLGLDYH